MINKVKNTMCTHGICPTKSVLVGLSGGADSVALLHVMHTLSKEMGFVVYAAHVNHNLRGEAALRDEEFSKSLCEKLNIQCFVKSADVKSIATQRHISEELAGRQVRYDFFSELMSEYDIEFTATAHHKNDNAETLVMNFIRGTGLSGLSGIPYKRDMFIRPMLDVTRCEIEEYCVNNGLSYVTDATNLDTVYTRNKIRNILIPDIEREFNPRFIETITSNADIISCEDDYLFEAADREYRRLVMNNVISVSALMTQHKAISRRIIRRMIDSECGISDVSAVVVDNVYNICKSGKTGLMCDIAKGVTARIEYDNLVIGKTPDVCEDFKYQIEIGKEQYIPELNCNISVDFVSNQADGEYFRLPDGVNSVIISNRRSGDKFVPKGMTGTKSVKEYMINEKIPKHLRSRIGIMRFNDDIAWIIGYRRDNRFIGNDISVKIKRGE